MRARFWLGTLFFGVTSAWVLAACGGKIDPNSGTGGSGGTPSVGGSGGVGGSEVGGAGGDGGAGGVGGSGGTNPVGGSGGDAGSGGVGGSGGSGGGPFTAANGYILVGQIMQQGNIQAAFSPMPIGQGCPTIDKVGACTVSDCSRPPQPGTLNAGSLIFRGLNVNGGGPLTVNPMGNRYMYTNNGPIFSPGADVSVQATGGQIPPFAFGGVVAPQDIRMKYPNPMPTTQDVPVYWDVIQPGTFAVPLFVSQNRQQLELLCFFPSEAGQGVIPAEALKFFAGSNGFGIPLSWRQQISNSPPYQIEFDLYTGQDAMPVRFQ